MSHAKFMIDQIEGTSKKVVSLLGISLETYQAYMDEIATEWLLGYYKGDTLAVYEVQEKNEFWAWWRLHAYYRNREWVDTAPVCKDNERLRNDWLLCHSSARLLNTNITQSYLLINSFINNKF
jgi:hypothetical protein